MRSKLVITALTGLITASLVGIGEYLLHYDELARFTHGGYEFMEGITADRSTLGHFLGVFGATLYPVGCIQFHYMVDSIGAEVTVRLEETSTLNRFLLLVKGYSPINLIC